MNKIILCLVGMLLLSLTSCFNITTNASDIYPHDELVGSVWELKTDAYIVDYNETIRKKYFLTPCIEDSFIDLESKYYPYNEELIDPHTFYTSSKTGVIGGLRKGELVKIVKVLKHNNFENGTFYYPIAIPLKDNKWTKGSKLYLGYYYDNLYSSDKFYPQGVLNPEYAKRIK